MKLYALVFFACLLAATRPAWPGDETPATRARTSREAFPGWSAGPVSPDWEKLTPSARDARFSKDFPGETGIFSDGTTTYVVRWLDHPTRRLHPASDCLRALGYDIIPRPLREKADGTLWSTCEAVRDGATVRVHERMLGADGRGWTDVSTWFWHASLGRATGPWWAVTEITPINGPRRH
jgi:hypothetical protein